MSRNRLAAVAVVLIAFVGVAGYVIYSGLHHGAQTVIINVSVTGAKSMSPSELAAHQNDTVTINITSDTTGEVHLHGYDIHFECTAGKVSSQAFKADKSGGFDIEWESTSTLLGHLVIAP